MTARSWAALTTVYVVWASTYLAIMVAIRTLPPLLMSSVRYLSAGAILYAFAARRGAGRPSLKHWRSAVIAGAALLLVGNGGVAWSEQRIDSGVAALLIATMPLWLALFDRIFAGRRLSASAVLGLVVGLGGVVLLVGPVGHGGIDAVGALGCLVAALSWAGGSLYARGAALPNDLLLGAAMQMLAAGVLLGLVGAASGEAAKVHTPSLASLGALAYLVVVGSLVAFSTYLWLMRSAPTSIVSTYAFVNPAIAVALGAAFLGEPLGLRMLGASAAIVVSVALIVTARRAVRRPRRPVLRPAREAA
ncbi:MAG TPA: EamA family transporter [Gaiellaceae bacterium]